MYDYFIIGQGLAGSVLAMELLKQGKRIHVFDSPQPNTSSSVAAGIMNPITGKRLTLSWKSKEMFPVAQQFYTALEEDLNQRFFYQMPVHRVFSSIGEQNDWIAKMGEEKYQAFVSPEAIKGLDETVYNNPFETLEVTGGGRLDVPIFLKSVLQRLQDLNSISSANIRHKDMIFDDGGVRVGGLTAQKVVFCTGHDQEVWSFLPFTPMKGELLEVESREIDDDKVVVGGCFLSPRGSGKFNVGATYDWRNTDLIITDAAKDQLLEKVRKFVSKPLSITNQFVGIRPAVKDRRPLLGVHPENNRLFLLSGLGSKGVSMVPYLAQHLCSFMDGKEDLIPELNLKRFL